MALTLDDLRRMLSGFGKAGYVCLSEPTSPTNPVELEWRIGDVLQKYRLWVFDVTHGGGGPTVRAADEYRIQITNGPPKMSDLDKGPAVDLLLGYSRERDSIVAYDRRWLEKWIKKKEAGGGRASPSVQVKEEDIQKGHDQGIYYFTKSADFGTAGIVTLSPDHLPAYLRNHRQVLRGNMTATEANKSVPSAEPPNVVEYCREQGFPFEDDLVARYLASLLSKPFVILAGVSGTGKSKLAELVAEFYSMKRIANGTDKKYDPKSRDKFTFATGDQVPDRDRFALIAVRPDWLDNQSILGFVNPITERYESTEALGLILRANMALENAERSFAAPRFFMLLDEMNLARVEHYFSDWLACSESRRLRPDQSIEQQPVPLHRSDSSMETTLLNQDGSTISVPVPGSLPLPTNLVVTGTVNVDETTYGFSPKVLDRAMVLEFDQVNLDNLRNQSNASGTTGYRFPQSLPEFRLATKDDYAALPASVHSHLVSINRILHTCNLHFGYRTANEIALFMRIYIDFLPADLDDTEWLTPLDAAILQKVLPRISGNRAKLELALSQLCAYFRDVAEPSADVRHEDFPASTSAKLPRSYSRSVEMLESLRSFGFVSFFK